jgi:hypothetical protein
MAHELHELTRISEKKEPCITTTKGSHGLHQDSFKLQTMAALIKSFCRGVQMFHGDGFLEKSPPWPPEARFLYLDTADVDNLLPLC